MPSLRDTLQESFIANIVGLLVGTILGGGAMFFVQRHVNGGDAARKEVVLQTIPVLEKFRRASVPMDWDVLMSLEDRPRSERFQYMVKATLARWDSLEDVADLIELKMRMSFDTVTAHDFSELVSDLGLFRDRIAAAGFEKSIGKKEVLLADTAAYFYFVGLEKSADSARVRIARFEHRLLKEM